MPSRKMSESIAGTESWYLTVVSCTDVVFLRPQKSWKPIVSVVADSDHIYDVVLGCDGRNPNLKAHIPLHAVAPATRLELQVWHKPASKGKNRKKRQLVGFANASLGELLARQEGPNAESVLLLAPPKPQKGAAPVKSVQRGRARLTLRLRHPGAPCSSQEHSYASSETAVDSPLSSEMEDKEPEEASAASETGRLFDEIEVIKSELVEDGAQLHRRRRTKGYKIYSDDESEDDDFMSDEPGTPPPNHPFPASFHTDDLDDCCAPAILPCRADDPVEEIETLTRAERFVDVFAPYTELKAAANADDTPALEDLLKRLTAEWQVIGGALLALCSIDSAIFGYQTPTLFPIDGLMQAVVAGGAIIAAFGLVCDAWFLMYYSGASGTKFRSLALDVYSSYLFFCLTCRMPTLCMLLAAVSLMTFVLGVAWAYYPGLVLVLSFFAGMCTTLQYLVFGFHRVFRFVADSVRRLCLLVRGRRAAGVSEVVGASGMREAVRAVPAGEVPASTEGFKCP